jgi:Carboxypeptidase regulatory-like domain
VQTLQRAGAVIGAAVLALFFSSVIPAQEPQPPAPPSDSTATPAPAGAPKKPGKQKYSHANDFVIRGTVFNEKALSFAGVQLRVRRANEKKFRWESSTASLGDFAIRVPQGHEYELVVHANGFADQSRTVDARNGDEEHMVFRMERVEAGKK